MNKRDDSNQLKKGPGLALLAANVLERGVRLEVSPRRSYSGVAWISNFVRLIFRRKQSSKIEGQPNGK